MRKGLRVAGPGLAVIVFSLLPFGAMAGAGRSPREALTPRVGREVPRPVPYRVFRAGSPSEASRALRPGERALLVLDDVGPRWYGRPVDELAEKLDAAVAAASGAKPHALVLGLANVPWGGGLETLNALYRHLKARWGIPVFQSYASPLPPHPAQLADGWVVAPRGLSGEEVRRYLVKFLVTGKPVLRLEAPAAEGPEAVPLLALCQRLAVPASFLSAAGCLQIQSRQAPRPRPDDVAYDLSELWQNLPDEADTLVAAPVQMGGDRVKRFDYCDPFRQEWFLDDATVVGVSRLRWPGPQGLKVVGKAPRRKVSLTYHFVGPWETRELVVELAGCVRGKGADFVELALSLDGKRFMHPARAYARAEGNPFHLTSVSNYRFDRESFWVRVTADLSPGSEAVLERFRVNCRVKPPGLHVVDLSPSRDGRLRYLEEFVSRRGGQPPRPRLDPRRPFPSRAPTRPGPHPPAVPVFRAPLADHRQGPQRGPGAGRRRGEFLRNLHRWLHPHRLGHGAASPGWVAWRHRVAGRKPGSPSRLPQWLLPPHHPGQLRWRGRGAVEHPRRHRGGSSARLDRHPPGRQVAGPLAHRPFSHRTDAHSRRSPRAPAGHPRDGDASA